MKELTPCPNPCRKDMFLRMYRKRTGSEKTEICEMIKSQFTYISAPIWITTFAALFIALWGAFTKHNVITGIAALMPFVSGFAVFESFRSRMYGMSELEGATLFSLRGVFFARTVCIGSVHILLILLLTLMISPVCQYDFYTTGIMITIPYLISSVISMKAEKSTFGRKNPLVCLGISAMTSGLVLALNMERISFPDYHTEIRYVLFIILTLLLLIEIKKTFQGEDYLWR